MPTGFMHSILLTDDEKLELINLVSLAVQELQCHKNTEKEMNSAKKLLKKIVNC